LVIDGFNTVIDLSGQTGIGCADPASSVFWGTISVGGTLLVRDATIQNTNVDVTLVDIGGISDIVNNDIRLLDTSGAGFGGEFFVAGTASIQCNVITSHGDRYLDIDPDPDAIPRPTVGDNKITVIINQGASGEQGELLELRSEDLDPAVGNGVSGAYPLISSAGYSDPWTLERLEVLPFSKVTLTNRQGFVFQNPAISTPEVLYAKEVVLHPGSILNTGLQRLFYQSLVDENGTPIDPALTTPERQQDRRCSASGLLAQGY